MTAMPEKTRVLMIGPATFGPGGVAVSSHYLLQSLKTHPQIEVEILDSYAIRGSGIFAVPRLLQLFIRILRAASRCDVISFQSMATALPYIGWFLPLAAKLHGKPLIFRSFGGMYYDELSWPGRIVARFFLRRADVVLLQTKELMEKAENDGLRRVEWFPTARPMPKESPPAREGNCRRFVYVGHLKTAKGLQYLARAAEQLPDDASVDVYGPWRDYGKLFDLPADTFDGCKKIRYVGVLQHHDVVSTLRQYDALVFPTFMTGEGYSGIVLEAYAAGIPVIATRWRALPEIVEDGVSGLLVEPRDERAILDAMMRFYQDPSLYRRLAAGAVAKRTRFSLENQVNHFVRLCRELAAVSAGDGLDSSPEEPSAAAGVESPRRIAP